MKVLVLSTLALGCLAGLGQMTNAQEVPVGSMNLVTPVKKTTTATGHVVNVYADPSDFVILSDVAGSCGSSFFHIQRSHTNFKEVTAVALMAFSTGKTMWFVVEDCANDRNLLSHVAAFKE